MFKSNRLGFILNLICMFGISVVIHVTILVSKFLPLIVILSLPLSFYFVYFAWQLILSVFTMKILPEKNDDHIDLRDSDIRPRKDVTNSL